MLPRVLRGERSDFTTEDTGEHGGEVPFIHSDGRFAGMRDFDDLRQH